MDSFTITWYVICQSEAPNDFAASTKLGLISLKQFSSNLAIKGDPATAMEKIAGPIPIDVPQIRRVRGMIAMIRMTNGMERRTLITTLIVS
ncbi:hypothetical protein D1872_300330 [compost metagenome]